MSSREGPLKIGATCLDRPSYSHRHRSAWVSKAGPEHTNGCPGFGKPPGPRQVSRHVAPLSACPLELAPLTVAAAPAVLGLMWRQSTVALSRWDHQRKTYAMCSIFPWTRPKLTLNTAAGQFLSILSPPGETPILSSCRPPSPPTGGGVH